MFNGDGISNFPLYFLKEITLTAKGSRIEEIMVDQSWGESRKI
jgi:hypothetical protein